MQKETSNPEEALQSLRNMKVYINPQEPISQKLGDLPESFFKLSSEELKQLLRMQDQKRKYEENKPLMTKAMRDKQDLERQKKYPKTMIRFKIERENIFIQATFLSEESIKSIFEFIQSISNSPEFILFTTPPMKKLEPSQMNLYKAQLTPASVVHIRPTAASSLSFLKEEILKMAEPLPLHPTLQQNEASSGQSGDRKETSSPGSHHNASSSSGGSTLGSNIPKWFKMGKK